jgi:hypothetical protein
MTADGPIAELDTDRVTASEVIAQHLERARVVKALAPAFRDARDQGPDRRGPARAFDAVCGWRGPRRNGVVAGLIEQD